MMLRLALEILLAIFLHPIALVLCWINILLRRDLDALKKVVWLIVTTIWGIGPIVYVLVGDGQMF
jgi:hypothetical protein